MDSATQHEELKPFQAHYGAGALKHACPGDEQDDPPWLLKFSDPDIRDQVFTGPGAAERAWAAWDQFAPSYNCYLFACPPIVGLTDDQKEVNARMAFDALGASIDTFGGNCPVQAEGAVDGARFYFRARGEHWEWHVAADDSQMFKNNLFYMDREYGDDRFAAGWMPRHEALAFMALGVRVYRADRDLRDAHGASGSDEPLEEWIRDMADDSEGTLRSAAALWLIHVAGVKE